MILHCAARYELATPHDKLICPIPVFVYASTMAEDFHMLEKQRRLLAREKAHRRDEVSVHEIPAKNLIEQQLKEERDGITLYSLPLLATGAVTQFFALVAVNPAALWGSTIMGSALMALGVLIFIDRSRKIGQLKRELKALKK